MKLSELTVVSDEVEDDDFDTQLEEDLSEAVDLLETCHKVLRRITKNTVVPESKYIKNLMADIEGFILNMDFEDLEEK